jgi:streptogramin lyase
VPIALATAAAVAGAIAFLTTRSPTTYVPTVGTVAPIEDGARFGAPIPVGAFPIGLAFGEGRIWVMDRRSQVYWFAPGDDHATSRGTTGIPTGATVGGGSVWITNGFGTGQGPDGGVSRLDPSTGETSPAFGTPIGSEGIAYGADAVWVANRSSGAITRYDPVQRSATDIALPGTETDPAEPDAIAFSDLDGPELWIGDDAHAQVFHLDANDPTKVLTSSIGGPATAIAVGAHEIWVASESTDSVYVLDPSSGSVRTSIDVGAGGCDAPLTIASGSDGIWVACSRSQRMVRIDPSTSTVEETLRVDGVPGALAVDGSGAVWVAVQPP